jgi:hypothetical protein
MSVSAESNQNYSFQPGEDTEHLISLTSKYVKLFESILAVCKAFKFENGRVTFNFAPSASSRQPAAVGGGGGVRMSTPQIFTFPSATDGLKQTIVQYLTRLSPEVKRQSVRSFLGTPLHPLVAVVFDSLRISNVISLLSDRTDSADEAFIDLLLPMASLLKRCILRDRPLDSLSSLLDQEASFLWDFFVSSISIAGLEELRPNFVNFFHSLVDHVFEYACKLETASDEQQLKREFSQETLRLLRSIARILETFAKNKSDLALEIIQGFISQCDWINRASGKFILQSWIGTGQGEIERPHCETAQKRRRIDDPENVNDQLKAFVEISDDGYFD